MCAVNTAPMVWNVRPVPTQTMIGRSNAVSYLAFKRMNPDDPDSLYMMIEDDVVTRTNLTYDEALNMIIKADNERWEKDA